MLRSSQKTGLAESHCAVGRTDRQFANSMIRKQTVNSKLTGQ